MTNLQIVQEIIGKLEKGHINLYHDITKEEILKFIQEVNWDELNDIEFDYNMLKLFSQFKDAHTRFFVPDKKLNHKLLYLNDVVYIQKGNNYYQVVSINNIDIKDIINKFSEIICYETQEWKCVEIEKCLNNKYYYEMLGIDKELNCYLDNNSSLCLNDLSQSVVEMITNIDAPYSYEIMEGDVLYLKYTACRHDPNINFFDFVKIIEKDIEKSNISKYIIDVRGNMGGNSQILDTFQNLVRRKKLMGVMLIDSKVFSSGRWAVAKFKKEFNITTIGTRTGGAIASYGYNHNDSVCNKAFSYSIRYWDFTDIFHYQGSIVPDIYVENSIEDLTMKYDRQLEEAKRFILTNKVNSNEKKK